MKIIAYHGSQENNLKLQPKPLYLTDDKGFAIEVAKGYNFGYDLIKSDKPTVYTMEVTFNNPKYIKTDRQYDLYMDIIGWDDEEGIKRKQLLKDYDGVIYKDKDYKDCCIYYMPLNAEKQCKILDKEEFPNERVYFESLNEQLQKYL